MTVGRLKSLIAKVSLAGTLAGLMVAQAVIGSADPVNFGQAESKQKKGDWAEGMAAYQALITDLWATQPNSLLLPKSYIGCAYCAFMVGENEVAYNALIDLWKTGAWANPNLPASPECEGYRMLLSGDYVGAIRSFAGLVQSYPVGSKKAQEAKISLAMCHLLILDSGHARIARTLLEEVSTEAGDGRMKAFAQWFTGVTYLGLMDTQTAEAFFQAASQTEPGFDPSVAAEELMQDQLEPGVNFKSAWGQTGSDLLQFLESYANAWFLTLKAKDEADAGNQAGAQALQSEAQLLWGQMNLASPSFPVY